MTSRDQDIDLRYPIGPFNFDGRADEDRRRGWIHHIEQAPTSVRTAVAGLSPERLDTPYRPGGWTIRQVVHHLPDSHLNAYTRFKLALTEDVPTIKPYQEARWAELPDARSGAIELSIALLESLHRRWVLLLRQLSSADYARQLVHPEQGRRMDLNELLAMYAWHGQHHVAQITSLRQRKGWH
jgi:uncharacterized damage-inducible protein DinB